LPVPWASSADRSVLTQFHELSDNLHVLLFLDGEATV